MEDGFSSYSSLYDTSSLLQFCNGKAAQPPGPAGPAGLTCHQLGKLGRDSTERRVCADGQGVGASTDGGKFHCRGSFWNRSASTVSLKCRGGREA